MTAAPCCRVVLVLDLEPLGLVASEPPEHADNTAAKIATRTSTTTNTSLPVTRSPRGSDSQGLTGSRSPEDLLHRAVPGARRRRPPHPSTGGGDDKRPDHGARLHLDPDPPIPGLEKGVVSRDAVL